MANPNLIPGFDINDTNTSAPSTSLQSDGYSFNEIITSGNFNYYLKQLYDASNKSANDGIWDWEDPATSDKVYNTNSITRHNGLLWESTSDSNTDEPGTASTWVNASFNNNETIHNLASDADYTLTSSQNKYFRISITDSGALLSAVRNIIVSDNPHFFTFSNETLFSLTVKTLAGAGVTVGAGSVMALLCDGTDVINLFEEVHADTIVGVGASSAPRLPYGIRGNNVRAAWAGRFVDAIQIQNGGFGGDSSFLTTNMLQNSYFDGTNDKYITTGVAGLAQVFSDEFRFYNAASGSAGANVTFDMKFQVDASGNTYNKTGTYGTISDERLKENIADATSKIADLLKVRVVNYNLIDDPSAQKMLGVVAQELEPIFPGMVEDFEDIDHMGNSKGVFKRVKYSVFVPMLIKAFQEQQAEINDIKTRLTNAGI